MAGPHILGPAVSCLLCSSLWHSLDGYSSCLSYCFELASLIILWYNVCIYILDNFKFNFNSNSKCSHIYKFKYQNMMNCADYHLTDHHAKIIQLSKVILMHNTVFISISIHTKINILKICWISKETLMHNSDTLMWNTSVTPLLNYYIFGKGKREIVLASLEMNLKLKN